MKIKDAANIGRGLVIFHLVLHTCLSIYNIVRIMPMNRGASATYLLTTSLYYVSALVLDIALLIVFSSLTRTKEQLVRDVGAEFWLDGPSARLG